MKTRSRGRGWAVFVHPDEKCVLGALSGRRLEMLLVAVTPVHFLRPPHVQTLVLALTLKSYKKNWRAESDEMILQKFQILQKYLCSKSSDAAALPR
jgi:hypothetical protein